MLGVAVGRAGGGLRVEGLLQGSAAGAQLLTPPLAALPASRWQRVQQTPPPSCWQPRYYRATTDNDKGGSGESSYAARWVDRPVLWACGPLGDQALGSWAAPGGGSVVFHHLYRLETNQAGVA